MKELKYPFDAKKLIREKKRMKRELYMDSEGFVEKRIAVLGGSTTSDIVELLEIFLLSWGIRPVIYESEYNQYYRDGMFKNEALENFGPDIIYIHTTNRNIEVLPSLEESVEEIENNRRQEFQRFSGIWKHLEETYHCPIIQNNFEPPLYRLLGNRDAVDPHGATHYINELNREFCHYAREHKGFYICDINFLAADYGLRQWQSPFYWYMYGYAMHVFAIPYLSYNVASIIKSIFGKNKKGLVLDLDNTLWGGVIGDVGAENIDLGHENAASETYLEFQEYIKKQKQIGVLLNISSKNEECNALAGLRHPDSKLSPDDFVEIRANWEPKDRNVQEIADSLQIFADSLVFVDDNPAEREIVSAQLPGIAVPEMGTPQEYIQILDRAGYFEVTDLSEDDKNRNKMYQMNKLRRQQEATFSNYEDYLRSLEMRAVIRAFEPVYMSRIAQLTNKSNQFNLTTKRYTQEEIEAASHDETRITLYGKMEDKFGDNGVVSVVIGRCEGNACHVELWLMSCRVLKRGMEQAMMDALVEQCQGKGIEAVYGYYYPTAKNGMVKHFYDDMGFEKTASDESGNTVWRLDIASGYSRKNTIIKVEGV